MPVRGTFATQAGALLRKNAVVQLKNWRVRRARRGAARRSAQRGPFTTRWRHR
jgi:hypothetical protein